jgi:hypothetical protein
MVLIYRDRGGIHRVTLDAGRADDLHVFREGNETFVLSLNHRLDYAGLQIFDTDGDEIGNIFASVDYEIKEMIGRRGLDYDPMTIAKRLAEYIT